MSGERDEHGQPHPAINLERVLLRSLDEVLGICKGMIVDGRITDTEVVALDQWLAANVRVAATWPASVLTQRLRSILADGIIDEEERADLHGLFEEIAGGQAEVITSANLSTAVAFTHPLPSVLYEDHEFCLTGRFVYGPRQRCEQAIIDRGGRAHPRVRRGTHYLVIGTFGSRDWVHSTHGTKIKAAVETGCHVIPEDHWAATLE